MKAAEKIVLIILAFILGWILLTLVAMCTVYQAIHAAKQPDLPYTHMKLISQLGRISHWECHGEPGNLACHEVKRGLRSK